MGLQVKRAGTKEAPKVYEGDALRGVGKVTYQLTDMIAAGFGDRSGDFEVDLVFKLTPGDEWLSLTEPSGRYATYFANAAERELTYTSAARADFSGSSTFGDNEIKKLQQALRFTLPPAEALFFKGYPGFLDSLAGRGGEARMTLQIDESSAPVEVVAELIRSKDGKPAILPRISSVTTRKLNILPKDEEAASYNVGVLYRLGNGEWTSVKLAGAAQLTVTGLKKPVAPKVASTSTTKPQFTEHPSCS